MMSVLRINAGFILHRNKIISLFFLVLMLMLFSKILRAETGTCYPGDNAPSRITVPLGASIYAGNDLPDGTVLYRVQITGTESSFACKTDSGEPFHVNAMVTVGTEPSGAAFNFAASPFNGSYVYPTNVPGIGVVMIAAGGNTAFSSDNPSRITQSAASGTYLSSWGLHTIALIKTGRITSGSSVQGISIPQIKFGVTETPGYTGLPVWTQYVNFSGAINIVTASCETNSFSVDLGSYDLRTTFTGIGSGSPWINSSITLSNCPAFVGYYDNSHKQYSTAGGAPSGNPIENSLLVTLTPATAVIDPIRGLMEIDASSSNAASGIGIQIGLGETSNPVLWNFSGTKTVTAPTDGRTTIQIPIAARYLQVDDVVSPGKADGKLMFTVSYN